MITTYIEKKYLEDDINKDEFLKKVENNIQSIIGRNLSIDELSVAIRFFRYVGFNSNYTRIKTEQFTECLEENEKAIFISLLKEINLSFATNVVINIAVLAMEEKY